MEKRANPRISVSIEIRFFYGKMFYSGTISDISINGMFIKTAECIPPDFKMVVLIPYRDDLIAVNSGVIRLRQERGCFSGMGVEILRVKNNYKEFVESLISVS